MEPVAEVVAAGTGLADAGCRAELLAAVVGHADATDETVAWDAGSADERIGILLFELALLAAEQAFAVAVLGVPDLEAVGVAHQLVAPAVAGALAVAVAHLLARLARLGRPIVP